jgi:hypothetical protein
VGLDRDAVGVGDAAEQEAMNKNRSEKMRLAAERKPVETTITDANLDEKIEEALSEDLSKNA